jgi:hypothetical protein
MLLQSFNIDGTHINITILINDDGLIMCKTCKVLWNRDENSSCNIFKVARTAINKMERPKYLCREKKKENLSVGSASLST